LPTINPTTNHLENKKNTEDISIEGDKAEQKTNINRISKKYNVPRSTMQNRISGCVTHDTKPGPQPYLTAEEEKSLTTHLIDAAKLGYRKTRKKVNRVAENVARKKGTLHKEKISNGWWRRFIERQSQLSLCQTDSIAHVRMDAISQESISWYFDLLESTLKEHLLEVFPSQIYNMDETGMPLDPRAPNIIAKSGHKR